MRGVPKGGGIMVTKYGSNGNEVDGSQVLLGNETLAQHSTA